MSLSFICYTACTPVQASAALAAVRVQSRTLDISVRSILDIFRLAGDRSEASL